MVEVCICVVRVKEHVKVVMSMSMCFVEWCVCACLCMHVCLCACVCTVYGDVFAPFKSKSLPCFSFITRAQRCRLRESLKLFHLLRIAKWYDMKMGVILLAASGFKSIQLLYRINYRYNV